MTLREAVAYAKGTPPDNRTKGGLALTEREMQVASLIAEGVTNGEIAIRLKMAERTADAHVEHIRNKLGLHTRSQIAIWAHEKLVRA
jgi:non-specific serine/threonine protein kinase